jgi:hypothetical protein
MSPSPKPNDSEPSTYFEIEQRRLDNPGETKVGGDVSSLPPQPKSSPWGAGPGPGDEPLINREEDGDKININEER